MSQPSPFRRRAVALVLAVAGVASIATSPPPRVEAHLEVPPFPLTAAQATLTQRLRVRLELDRGREGREANASLDLSSQVFPAAAGAGPDGGTADAGTVDAGTVDAGSPPAASPVVVLTVRDAAHPDVVLSRDSRPLTVELMRDCDQRICEQELLLEWRLGEGSAPPVTVHPWAHMHTQIDPDDGVATLELVP
jgi:hypothetical protein